MSNVEDMVEI